MPYISKERRKEIDFNSDLGHPGELNFLITMLMKHYLRVNGTSYSVINKVIGVLECAKLEMYRRIAAPYEDTKIKENGDVY